MDKALGTGEVLPESLTPRERDILTWLASDLSSRKIAERLVLAPSSVKWYTKQIYAKLGVSDRQQAITRARELGLMESHRSLLQLVSNSSTFAVRLPAFLREPEDTEFPRFVGRERELRRLDGLLQEALAGHGRLAFITGDPGQGKTSLLQEFSRQAQASHPELIAANGSCRAYTGPGDPYLPFREILGMLTGDVEGRQSARSVSREQARRLWENLPVMAECMVEAAPDLVGSLIPAMPLAERLASFLPRLDGANWLTRMEQLLEQKCAASGPSDFGDCGLFEQYARLIGSAALRRPLLLTLDDLHWADQGSINLLFHLAETIAPRRVLIICAFRLVEVALGRGEKRHPLAPVINELKSRSGDVEIDLNRAEGRPFIDAFLDMEPNCLDESFRSTLYRLTRGHPLATVELLRDMQERGGLVQNDNGQWVETTALEWDTLPARTQAIIGERIGRLDERCRTVLRIASVEGESFTAEVLAQVLGADDREIRGCLSAALDKIHHLVEAQGVQRAGVQLLSIYRFRHILFQRYLYNSLDAVERTHLHKAVGTALQSLYGDRAAQVAVQLARHFQAAGTGHKAADYLFLAGERASGMAAHREAMEHYRQAMEAYRGSLGEKRDAFQQAVLERKIGEILYRRGEHREALSHFERGLAHLNHPLPGSHWGTRLAIAGEILRQFFHRIVPRKLPRQIHQKVDPSVVEAVRCCELIGWISFRTDVQRFALVSLRSLNISESAGYDYGIVAGSSALGALLQLIPLFRPARGYHERAVKLAEQMQNPEALGCAYVFMGLFRAVRGENESALDYAERAAEARQVAGNLRGWGYAMNLKASTLCQLGRFAEAIEQCRKMVQISQSRCDVELECWAWSKEGRAELRRGDLEQAYLSLQRAIRLSKDIPDSAVQIEAGTEMGRYYLRAGDLEGAITTLEDCQRRNEEHPTGWGVREGLLNTLSEAYLCMAERCQGSERLKWVERAEDACAKALRQARTDRRALPEAMLLAGRNEYLKGRIGLANDWWQRSLAAAERNGQLYDAGRVHLEIGMRLENPGEIQRGREALSEIGAAETGFRP